ncbi:bile acid:sodium symporter [Marinobacter sp. F3R08]|nr:bile acid:sodium symporter [Marinobacter sp. F3R08]MBU2955861.1 bile acid:sodium symporter [Marinobacter sp. F3R08]
MGLSTDNFKHGASRWKLHLMVQLSTFALFRCGGCCSMRWWSQHGLSLMVMTAVGVCLFLFPFLWLTKSIAKALNFPVEDEIVAVFCGSKKTLASGVPMAKLLFAGNPAMGVLVLPIMFYHQLQLFVCAVMAKRYAELRSMVTLGFRSGFSSRKQKRTFRSLAFWSIFSLRDV